MGREWTSSKEPVKSSEIRLSAFNMLARREHSRKELLEKLGRRFDDDSLVETVLNDLRNEGLQSDERFTESFVSSRVQRQQGPVKIAYELRQKGVAEELIDSVMGEYRNQWLELANQLVQKKYGEQPPENYSDKQRRMRFVMQRGFPAEICYKLFD